MYLDPAHVRKCLTVQQSYPRIVNYYECIDFKRITDGRGRVLTGVSPRHGSHAAALVACDAFNARTTTERE